MKYPLIELLRRPGLASVLDETDWDVVVRQAREAGVLGRLDAWLDRAGAAGNVPAYVARHVAWARTLVEACHREVRHELTELARVLGELPGPVVLLKGAAYVVHYREAASGRFFEDVDLMVPDDQLKALESRLLSSGWTATHLEEYDQRYYRQWMHELPPLQHIHRGTTLDVHFNILPVRGRLRVSAEMLLANVRPVADWPFAVLDDVDAVLHSALHLGCNEAWDSALRDATDLVLLLEARRGDRNWPHRLAQRAKELGLARELKVILALLERLLLWRDERLKEALGRDGDGLRAAWLAGAMSAAAHPSAGQSRQPLVRLGRWLLFMRGQWLKLPWPLWLYHLLHKAFDGLRTSRQGNVQQA